MHTVKDLVRHLEKQPGLTVEKAKNGHHKVRRNGNYLATVPSTTKDANRSIRNCVALLRRKGVSIP